MIGKLKQWLETRNQGDGDAYSGAWLAARRSRIQGGEVNPFALPAILCGVNLIAGTISSLPKRIVDDKNQIVDHPLTALLNREPCNYCNAFELFESMVAYAVIGGDGYVYARRNRNGEIVELRPVNGMVDATFIDSPRGPRIDYRLTSPLRSGHQRVLSRDDMVHLRFMYLNSMDPHGLSITTQAQNAMNEMKASSAQVQEWMNRGLFPSAVISFPANVTPMASGVAGQFLDNIEDRLRGKGGRPLLLQRGGKFESPAVNPREFQLIEERRFMVDEAARVLAIPSPLLMAERNVYKSIQDVFLQWTRTGLQSWVSRIEHSFSRILESGYRLQIDMSGLNRSNFLERAQGNAAMRSAGIVSINELRRQEGLNLLDDPRADDVFYKGEQPETTEQEDNDDNPDQ